MMSITQELFNHQCVEFVKRCIELNENWSLMFDNSGEIDRVQTNDFNSNKILNSKLMLVKKDFRSTIANVIQTYEYNVLYSESFEVPVMYFCISNQDGSPVGLDDIGTQVFDDFENDIGPVLSQVEHPLIFRPFYMIHPCKTKNFMKPHARIDLNNYLVCWLSTVGTILNLKFDSRLAEINKTKN